VPGCTSSAGVFAKAAHRSFLSAAYKHCSVAGIDGLRAVASIQRCGLVNPAEEYMKDTEDYINIELDSSQNRLFRLDIVLTAAAFSMEIFHVMGGGAAVACVPTAAMTSNCRAWCDKGTLMHAQKANFL
jgi:hypothetical protein